MMNLHKDKETFKRIIMIIFENKGIEYDIIEKDYYVTMILKELRNLDPGLVFKGGTCLSKAFHIIDRFSEDIDLTYLDKKILNTKKEKGTKISISRYC